MKQVLVELTALAVKDLKGLAKLEEEILGHLRELKTSPKKGHGLVQNLQGARALEFTVKGSGDFRAAYVFQEDEEKVTIFLIGPHENFYDEAGRRVKLIKDLIKKVRESTREKSQKKTTTKKPKDARN